MTSGLFGASRARSERAVEELARLVREELRDDAKLLDKHCLYITGSAARGEMSEHSDLDLFVIRLEGSTRRLDDAPLTTAITRALRAMNKPDPSKDGLFVQPQLAEELITQIGTERDDFYNHFTARMLLLLESKPLVADGTYDRLITTVVDRYWTNAAAHKSDHIPYVLVNDIIRYWRILLLNYEAKVGGKDPDSGARRLASYKLRFSRCLTCFSGLTYLMARYRQNPNLEREAGLDMVRLSPLDRLAKVREMEPEAGERIDQLESLYSGFLSHTSDAPKGEIEARFADPDFRKARSKEARTFGDQVFDLVMQLGEGRGREMLRIVVV